MTTTFDPDARAVLDVMREAMPVPQSEMPFAELRALANGPHPGGPELASVTDTTVPGPAGAVPVRVYRPAGEAPRPTLLWMHGGGFAIGGLNMVDPLCRELASAAGALVASVDYRLAPEHPYPAGPQDSYAALQWLAGEAAALGGDPQRLAVGGDSAGAVLAMVLAQMARDLDGPAIGLQVIAYGAGDPLVSNPELGDLPMLRTADCEWYWDMYAGAAAREQPYCCPGKARDLSGLPPAIVLTATHDPSRDGCEAYGHRLAAAGVRTTMKRYPGTFHGFLGMTHLARSREGIADIALALGQLRPGRPPAAETPAHDHPDPEGEPMAVIDQHTTWRKVEERLAAETDSVLRRNLELLLTHMKAEAELDLPTLMSTVSERAVYRTFSQDPATWPRGKAGVQAFYESFAASGAQKLAHDLDRLVVDRHCILTEGTMRMAWPGRTLLAQGIEVDDPDAEYLYEARLAILWPIGEDGLFTGEDSYVAGDGFAGIADRKLDPADVVVYQRAGAPG